MSSVTPPAAPLARRSWLAVAAVVGLLVATNLLDNWLLPGAYLLIHLVMAVALVAVARRDGLTWRDLGLDRRDWRRGLIWAAGLVAVVATVLVIAAVVPGLSGFFDDDKATDLSGAALLWQLLIRIPLGTAVFEELAFRGVLFGLLLPRIGIRAAALWSSVLFGLWHVLPSLDLSDRNEGLQSVGLWAVLLSVAFTTLAGLLLTWVRVRSGSLLAPIALHWAVNALALAVVWLIAT
jgi:membrane protease YdiL (CAAX protease family)